MSHGARGSTMLLGFLILVPMFAADPAPEFSAAGVVRGAEMTQIFVPGSGGMSIYGSHLGPRQGCSATPDPTLRETPNPRAPDPTFADLSVYPKELCSTQVWIGDKPAGLLYVSERQINFKIPQDSAESGTVELRVVYQGRSSAPVAMEAGFEKASISLDSPAYTNMPIWLKLQLPLRWEGQMYPFVLGPAGFGCNHVEVRREGKPLTIQPGANWERYGVSLSGNICGSYALPAGPRSVDRLPLHLLYRFDIPGTYEVRFTIDKGPFGVASNESRLSSEWTPIEILPSTPNQRAKWLNDLRNRAPTGPGEILSDFLPSVLGIPDDASLEIVLEYLYDPNAAVRRYAMDGLAYWPEDFISRRLLALLHTRGPSDELIRFLTRQREFGLAHAVEIVAASLPFLQSDSSVAMDGALAAARQASTSESTVIPALLQSAEHIVSHGDDQNRADMFGMLAAGKSEQAHQVLRKALREGYGVAADALASFRDSNDLLSLAALLEMPDPAKEDQFVYLPELLYTSFGAAAVPHLRAALSAPLGRFTKRNVALQLMAAGDPAGFQFALNILGKKDGLRTGMAQEIKNRFPELKDANDGALMTFVRDRAGN